MESAGPAFSIAAVGLKAAGDYTKAQGVAAEDEYRAAELDRAAKYGDLKATQTNAQMTRNLTISLGQLDAIRAAGRDDPTSPTGAAVRDFKEQVGTEDKNIRVDSIVAQAQQDEADAAYMRTSASNALLSGQLAVAGDIAGGAGGLVKSAGT